MPYVVFAIAGVILLLLRLTEKIVTEKLKMHARGIGVRIFVAVLGAGGITLSIWGCFGSSEAPCPSSEIIAPSSGSTVGRQVTVKGTAKIVSGGKTLWLIASPKGSSRWWPQGSISTSSGSNEWERKVSLGGNPGQRFTLNVICAAPEAHQTFINYIEEAERTKTYNGTPQLESTTSVAAVEVILGD